MLIIGVGNAYRRDDAAGLIAARQLWEAAQGAATLREASGEGGDLLDAWAGADVVILLDAVCSGAAAGTVLRIDGRADTIPPGLFRYSTHAFSVADAIGLARVLNRLPPHLIVLGIEGAHFDAGRELSPDVERGVEEAVRRGLAEIEDALGRRPGGASGVSP